MANRKPSWPLWCAAAAILLPVAYVLGFGPASLIYDRTRPAFLTDGGGGTEWLVSAYVPLQWSPKWSHKALQDYGALFMGPDQNWLFVRAVMIARPPIAYENGRRIR